MSTSDHPKHRLAIDWNGLEDAQLTLSAMRGEMEASLRYFLDRDTGKVVSLTESAFAAAAGEEPEPFTGELPDEGQVELARRIVADRSRYLDVPMVDETRDEYRDMEVFIAEDVTNPHLAEVLAVAIRGRGAFRRFKDVLGDHPEERDRWFAFSHRRSRQRLLDWLEAEGIEAVSPPDADEPVQGGRR